MITRTFLTLAALLTCVFATSEAGATLVATSTDSGSGNQQQFAGNLSATDLINNGQSTLSGVTTTGYTAIFGGAPTTSVLNDGLYGTDGNAGVSTVVFDADSFSVTYDLDVTTNTLGYNLSEIRSYAAWNDNRAGQNYEVFVSTVGSATFSSLGTFGVATPGGTNQASRLTLNDDTNTYFATGADAIRFTILGPNPNEDAYREFDVEGVATAPAPAPAPTPEPNTLVLAVLGLFGLALGRRRRIRRS